MSPVEIADEIARIERILPRLRDLGDVAVQERRLTALRNHLEAQSKIRHIERPTVWDVTSADGVAA